MVVRKEHKVLREDEGGKERKKNFSYLKSRSTAWGNVWKLLFLLISVWSCSAILPNICTERKGSSHSTDDVSTETLG